MPFKDMPNIRFKASPSKEHRHELLTSTTKMEVEFVWLPVTLDCCLPDDGVEYSLFVWMTK